ncbi:hypothetical protein MW887_004807 [Aspergillus wentii]|nr:hypothetical protein MW887_004807 [Aspergillus wentii]
MASSELTPEYTTFEAYLDKAVALLVVVGWNSCFLQMIYQSFRHRTYNIPFLPLFCNVTWDFIYAFMYPSPTPIIHYTGLLWFVFDSILTYGAMKFASNEWSHAPLIQRNIPLIFALGIAGAASGHLAFVAQFGPVVGFRAGGLLCQLLHSGGALCQLLCRGSTRGTSSTIWLGRALGSGSLAVRTVYRFFYRPNMANMGIEGNGPLYMWFYLAYVFFDGIYGIVFFLIKRSESSSVKKGKVY